MPIKSRSIRFEDSVVLLLSDLYRFALRFEKRPSFAEDLVQDTVLKALSRRDAFVEGTNLRRWLFCILRNTFYTAYKRQTREPVGLLTCVSGTAGNVDPDQEWSMRVNEVAVAIKHLSVGQRDALLLVASGVQYEDAAQACGCEVGTVKSRVNRARNQIALELGEENGQGGSTVR
jgi:RNA polymerase sigma-70 factor (ECF subfamily)